MTPEDKSKIAQVHIRMPVELRDRLVIKLEEEYEYPPNLSTFFRRMTEDYLEGEHDR
jgi:hypothetical protein